MSHMSKVLAHMSVDELDTLVQVPISLVKVAEAHEGESKDGHD